MHQILIIVNKDKIVIKKYLGCYGRSDFVGMLLDSVHLIPL